MFTEYANSVFSIAAIAIILMDFYLVPYTQGSASAYDEGICSKGVDEDEECLLNYFNSIRERLKQGMPEINLPQLEPFWLDEIEVFPGENSTIKAIGQNITVHGVSSYDIHTMKFDFEKMKMNVSMDLPYAEYEGLYDVNGNILGLTLRGKGPIRGNISDVKIQTIFKIEFETVNNTKYIRFLDAYSEYSYSDLMVKLDKLLPIKRLNDAINAVIDKMKFPVMRLYRHTISRVINRITIDIMNGVMKYVPFFRTFGQCFNCTSSNLITD